MTYHAVKTSGHFKPLAWLLPIQINAEINTISPYFANSDWASNAAIAPMICRSLWAICHSWTAPTVRVKM
jgi:hypothetical protein